MQRRRGWDHLDLVGWILVAISLRVVFALETRRVWEDALITIAHAQNVLSGLGLTHHPGEGPTHGFTSVASVAIPVLGELAMPDGGLIALRLASIGAVVVALWFAWHIAVDLNLSAAGRFLVLGYLAIEQNHIFYGMAGMETQVAVAVVLGGFRYAIAGDAIRTGIAAGLAVLVRPELLVLLVPFLLLAMWLRSGGMSAVRTGVVAAIVPMPWVIFATVYYGTPIPHTIIAKATSFSTLPDADTSLGTIVEPLLAHIEPLLRTFMPFRADTMVSAVPVPDLLLVLVASMTVVAAGIGMVDARRDRRWWGLAGFLLAYTAYRVLFLPTSYYDWYVPPMTAVAILFVARGLDAVFRRPTARMVVAVVLLVAFVVPLPWFLSIERTVQKVAEDGVRRPVAAYLREHVGPEESVVAEAAGYIGSSGVLLWDFPGLTSPTAYRFVQQIPREDRTVWGLVAAARPDWAVLRPQELELLRTSSPESFAAYAPCAEIGPGGVSIAANGLAKHSVDLQFVILRRGAC